MDPNEDLTLLKISFLWQEEMHSNWGPLSYYSAGKSEICFVGNSYVKGAFGKILIKCSDADNGNHMFAAPAENREEACFFLVSLCLNWFRSKKDARNAYTR